MFLNPLSAWVLRQLLRRRDALKLQAPAVAVGKLETIFQRRDEYNQLRVRWSRNSGNGLHTSPRLRFVVHHRTWDLYPTTPSQIPNNNKMVCPYPMNRGIYVQSHKFVGIWLSIEWGQFVLMLFGFPLNNKPHESKLCTHGYLWSQFYRNSIQELNWIHNSITSQQIFPYIGNEQNEERISPKKRPQNITTQQTENMEFTWNTGKSMLTLHTLSYCSLFQVTYRRVHVSA